MAKKPQAGTQVNTEIDPADDFIDPALALAQQENETENLDDAVIAAPVPEESTPELPAGPIQEYVPKQAVRELLSEQTIREVLLNLPVCLDEIDPKVHGYVSSRLDCDLTGEAGLTFKRLLLGLRAKHATYVWGGRVLHVDGPHDLIRYLMMLIAGKVQGKGADE